MNLTPKEILLPNTTKEATSLGYIPDRIKLFHFTETEASISSMAWNLQRLKMLGGKAIYGGLLSDEQISTIANPNNPKKVKYEARKLNKLSESDPSSIVIAQMNIPNLNFRPGTLPMVVGYGQRSIKQSDGEKTINIDSLIVDPNYTGRGIGRLILCELIEDAPANLRVTTHLPSSNPRTTKFLEENGFRIEGYSEQKYFTGRLPITHYVAPGVAYITNRKSAEQ